jgi:hypothetical protein
MYTALYYLRILVLHQYTSVSWMLGGPSLCLANEPHASGGIGENLDTVSEVPYINRQDKSGKKIIWVLGKTVNNVLGGGGHFQCYSMALKKSARKKLPDTDGR